MTSGPRRPVLILGALLWMVLGLAVYWAGWGRGADAPLPAPIAEVPRFALVDQDGRRVTDGMLRGAPYVASFLFTRCKSVCPMIARRVRLLQERSEAAGLPVSLISFSVDPAYDTPERLRAYARKVGARPERWRFLTGDPKAVRAVVVDGFGGAMDPVHRPGSGGPAELVGIAHATRLVVVDAEGRIRGYFGTDDASLEGVLSLLRRLRAARKRP